MPRVIVDRSNASLEEAGLSCPCNCFRKNNGEYIIDPTSCIDCGVCQTIASDSIVEDSEASEVDIEFNTKNAETWEQIQ